MHTAASEQGRAPVPHTIDSSPYLLKHDAYSSHALILNLLGEGRGRRLLDLGAAQGDMAQLLTAAGFVVTAVEGDPTLAGLARGKCHDVVVADLDRPLPALGGGFDVAVCGDILEHLKDPLGALIQAAHQVKPGGLFVVSIPNVAHLWMRLQLARGRFDYMDRGIMDRTHLRFFTLKSFREMLAEAGLTILKLEATPVPLPLVVPARYHGHILNTIHAGSALLARMWKTMFAYQFVALARKGGAV
jgi:2-polyprenyl-3-methyl-5-hydroxy-6-metoxy-1,4-benzoquinol methylase